MMQRISLAKLHGPVAKQVTQEDLDPTDQLGVGLRGFLLYGQVRIGNHRDEVRPNDMRDKEARLSAFFPVAEDPMLVEGPSRFSVGAVEFLPQRRSTMQEKEFYSQILGLKSPWFVSEVKLDTVAEQVDVFVEHPSGTKFCCPKCNQELAVYDHTSSRTWRHLDTMQFKTMLHASTPRVQCPEHGVRQVQVPWADGSSRFTLLFERFAIDVLHSTQNVKGAQSILRTGWEQAWNILHRAVGRGMARKQEQPMPRIGIDEKSFAKGQSYFTLLYDLDRSTVEAISEGCDTEAADACFAQLSQAQINSVEAIAMDMSAAFVKSAKGNIPLAEEKIVHDRFHVMKLATEAVR